MKGLDAPVLIGIIIAVIAGVIILYFLWSKGLLPFFGGASEAECKNDLIRACNNQLEWSKINKFCPNYFSDAQKSYLETCLSSENPEIEDACNRFCASYLGGTV